MKTFYGDFQPFFPTAKCDGYPLVFFKNKPEEFSFYIPMKVGNVQHQIACSWIQPKNHSSTYDNSDKRSTKNRYLKGIHPSLASIDKNEKVIIVCHGSFSWRNQMLISNIASEIAQSTRDQLSSCHTLRFDFRGNGHSSGKWHFDSFENDLKDLCAVYDFVTKQMGCEVICLIGHSHGSAAIMNHAALMEQQRNSDGKTIHPYYVNLAGRCTTENDFEMNSSFTKEQIHEFESTDKIVLPKIGRRQRVITKESVKGRNSYDLCKIVTNNIRKTKVLTIHGDNDKVVSVRNAYKYDEIIPNHTKKIIKGADHNFNGCKFIDDIVGMVADFLAS